MVEESLVNLCSEDWCYEWDDLGDWENSATVTPMPDAHELDAADVEPSPEPNQEHLRVLKDLFGHARFRDMQWKVIKSIMEDHADNCLIMSTGYGKSLCYQFPAVFANGTVLVISPLISLMQDQVQGLEVKGISSCFLGSAQMNKSATRRRIMANFYRIVYATPEFCIGDEGQRLIAEMGQKCRVKLVAIDEAHCVSQWGFDFRRQYRQLARLRELLPDIPFLATTATATPHVRDDICTNLNLRFPVVTCTGLDRPNLYLACDLKTKSRDLFEDFQKHMVYDAKTGKWAFEGPTIVYCATRDMTERISERLRIAGVSCDFYHAKVDLDIRKQRHEDFSKDKIQCIVATIAFGMGIDKPDVRLVIHYACPKNLESYYQEVGRAGRDGLRAHCHCYYNGGDHSTNLYLIRQAEDTSTHERLYELLAKMEAYVASKKCRRRVILAYFEDEEVADEVEPNKDCCDNCDRRLLELQAAVKIEDDLVNRKRVPPPPIEDDLLVDGKNDFTDDVVTLLKAVQVFNGRTGIIKPIKFLRGSGSGELSAHLLSHPLFASGKHRTVPWWQGLAKMLLPAGYLHEAMSDQYKLTSVSREGVTLLQRMAVEPGRRVMLAPGDDMYEMLQREARKKRLQAMVSARQAAAIMRREEEARRKAYAIPIKSVDLLNLSEISSKSPVDKRLQLELYRELIQLNNQLACDAQCMPYMVCGRKALMELATMRPSTLALLKLVDGFTDAKVSKFGQALLDKIDSFCLRHSYSRDGGILPLLALAQAEEAASPRLPSSNTENTAPSSQAGVTPEPDTTPELAKEQETVEAAASSRVGRKRSYQRKLKERIPSTSSLKNSRQRGIREFLTSSPEKKLSTCHEVKMKEAIMNATSDLNLVNVQTPPLKSKTDVLPQIQETTKGISQETIINPTRDLNTLFLQMPALKSSAVGSAQSWKMNIKMEITMNDSQETVVNATRDMNNVCHQIPILKSSSVGASQSDKVKENSQETVLSGIQATKELRVNELLTSKEAEVAILDWNDSGIMEIQSSDSIEPKMDTDLNRPITSEVHWGDDDLFQSIDIEKLSPRKSASQPSDWGNDDDFNIDDQALCELESVDQDMINDASVMGSQKSQESRGSQDSQGSQGGVKKRKMPTWLMNPEAGKVMKRNMMANSLFKRH